MISRSPLCRPYLFQCGSRRPAPHATMDFVSVYWIKVEKETWWTRSDFFLSMPLHKRKALGFYSGKGTETNPIKLDFGFTAKEMKTLHKSVEMYSSRQPSQLLSQCDIFVTGRTAQFFRMDKVLMWLRDGFFAACARAASINAHFVSEMAQNEALIYPMNFWCAMMLIQGVLRPIRALVFAHLKMETHYIPEIFAAAAYRVLLDGGPDHSLLSPTDRLYIGSVLSKHIRTGCHSLQTTWRVLNRSPGVLMPLEPGDGEHDHAMCVDFWEYAWEQLDATCQEPEYALIERYSEFEEKLSVSPFASRCRAACWKRAVVAISAKRSSLIRSLPHHFDF
ncbi:hypothetical protein BJ165DRAFT_1142698 [Panaeolus papilionaceus]|nr:hypothetical protein BJ165DRAFT_1142698 [Panaeolus papilionaceus]